MSKVIDHLFAKRQEDRTSADSPSRSIFFNPFGKLTGALFNQINEREKKDTAATEQEMRDLLSEIAVISFVGQSGTGKSTRALRLAGKYDLSYIIDDGLLIHGSSIVAGSTAKKAATKLQSVKDALFLDQLKAEQMRRALAAHKPKTLMIIGTSDAMLERICNNLWLNQPSIKLRIEDFTTEEERNQARHTRLYEGKHTIPVPSMEIKHEFSGSLAMPWQKLRQKIDRNFNANNANDVAADPSRTVVRPTFSTLGNYSISDEAMQELVRNIALDVTGVAGVSEIKIKKDAYGVIIKIDLAILFRYSAPKVLRQAQRQINDKLEYYTSINVIAVNCRAMRVELASK